MEGANYCKKCGFSLISNQQPISSTNTKSDSNFKVIVICLTIIIIAGIAMIAIFASGILDNNNANYPVIVGVNSPDASSSSTTASSSGQWVLIASYTGSGTGAQSFSVPSGKIRIDISAYPIKNYASNYLNLNGDNGASDSLNWGFTSDVVTKSDSISFTSDSSVIFNVDYYETVSWSVKVYKYQ